MLANMIQEILSKVLEKYVEKIKDEDMEMNLMGGNIKFQNLLLKKTLLSDLEVPFEMRYGKIQSLQAKLMIAKIGAEPVEVTINGLYFLLRLKEGLLNNSRRNWDLQEKKLWIIKYIQRNTQNIADRVKRDLAGGNQGGMFSKIGMKILDNLQIYISNIHLQIESVDQDSHPFAFGIGINELRVFTTNENWERCFLDRTLPANSSAPLNKCINANIFLYFLTSSEGYISEKSPDFSSPPTIPKEGHILAPIDITIHLTHRQNTEDSIPNLEAEIIFKSLTLQVSKVHYRMYLALAERASVLMRENSHSMVKRRFAIYRPVLDILNSGATSDPGVPTRRIT